jgi:TM2 domain-containing membrane protein YozV
MISLTEKTHFIIAFFIVMVFWLFGAGGIYAGMIIRGLFILLATLFPAMLYYLFISTRKYGLLDEFLIKLDRLGLRKKGSEDVFIYYLKRFQVIYGKLPDDILKNLPENSREVKDNFKPGTPLPVILATLLIGSLWFLALPLGPDANLPIKDVLVIEKSPEIFAFLGAYWFSIQRLVRRYFRRDLRSSTYVGVSMRITVAIIGIWAVEATGIIESDETLRYMTGFAIGVFPRTAWQIIEASFKAVFGRLPGRVFRTPLPLRELDGITVWNEARFMEEDIENIPQMATADIPNLMLTTRIAPDRIIDWVDQAILYTHVGPEDNNSGSIRRQLLRSYGIRSATSLIDVADEIKSGLVSRNEIQSLVAAVKTHPNLKLIENWKKS